MQHLLFFGQMSFGNKVVWLSSVILISGSISSLISPAAQAASSIEVAKIAKAVTVNIESADSPGSGVIVQKTNNTYTVITAAHVLRDPKSAFKLVTPDGNIHKLTNIKATPGTDIAVAKFQSNTSYPVAKMGDSAQSPEGATVYVAGFPMATQAISASIYNFTEGKVTANANRPLAEGYSLVYSNNTLPGMSGGPVFNDTGELIAIHGRGDTQESSQVSEINQNVRIKTGFNLGITTSTFLKLASNLGFNSRDQVVIAKRSTALKADDYFLQGVDLFQRGRWSSSIELMDKAIKKDRNYLRAYLARGAANFMQNRIGAAMDDTDQALKIFPNYAMAHASKCFFLNEFKNYGQALGHCNRAIELAPKSAITYSIRGAVKISLQDLGGAEGDLLRSIELDPKSYYGYSNLSAAYGKRQIPQVAIRYAREALSLNPNSAAVRVQYAEALVGEKQYNMAIAEVNRAISINPRISNAYRVRSLAHLGLGNTAQAQRDSDFAKSTAFSNPQGAIEDLSFLSQ
jgi:tetratricopeptide (TPR) repeat protein/V8-like Glu-specific endopeptidase